MKFITFLKRVRLIGPRLAFFKTIKHICSPHIKKKLYVREVQILKEKVSNAHFCIETAPPLESVSDNIWVCWLQGEDRMPGVVRLCYDSIRKQAGNHEVVLVSLDNYKHFCDIPARIEQLYLSGGIMPANFADILRVNLLAQKGGLWLDATIFAISPIPEDYFAKPFFSMKFQPDSYEISHRRWVSYCLGRGQRKDPIFSKIASFLDDYTSRFDFFWDYFLIDYALDYLYDNDDEARHAIDEIPMNNVGTTKLLPMLCSDFNESSFVEIIEGTVLFKLRYRENEEVIDDLLGDGKTVFCHLCKLIYDGEMPFKVKDD